MYTYALLTSLAVASAQYAAQYGCNPAHQYPEGQKCVSQDGQLTLVTETGYPTSQVPYPTSEVASSYPAASNTFTCNPAHQYPEGRRCVEQNGSLTLLPTTVQPTGAPQTTQPAGAPQPTGAQPTGQAPTKVSPPIATGAASSNSPIAAAALVAVAYAIMA